MDTRLRTPEEIKEKRDVLAKEAEYLSNFLKSLYKGNDAVQKVDERLKYIRHQILLLDWVLKDGELPF